MQPLRLTGSSHFTAAQTSAHHQGRQKTARLFLVSLEPSVCAEPCQTGQGEKRSKATIEPHRQELLALWQQSLTQAMTEVEVMLRCRERAVPRQTATAGGRDRRPQGGAAAPDAPGQGAGPFPEPALFTEDDTASSAAHSLTIQRIGV